MGMESVYKLSVLVNMIDRISGPSATIRRAVGETASQFQDYSQSMARIAADGAVLIGSGHQIAAAALAPVKATFETQDALGVLASMGAQDLKTLEDAAHSFASTWAGTTKAQFLQAATDIKGGIDSLSDEGVAGYTRIAGVTAKATQASIAEMTNLFAVGYGIYKDYYDQLSDLEFGEMFSAGVADAIRVFKADGASVAQAISSLGGSATMANVPLEEQLGILGMLMATMSGSEAGTKYTAFLSNAAKAGKELGLNFTDANGQLRSMPEILGQIRGKFGETMTAADKLELQKAFGTVEAVKLIDLLYGKTDALQGNILTLYDSMSKGMSITEEMANKVNAPPGQQWEILKQKMQSTLETIGNAMLPTFVRLQEKAHSTATRISEFAEKYPGLTSSVMYGAMAFGSFLIVLGSLKFVFGAVASAALLLGKAIAFPGKALQALKFAIFLVQYGAYNAKIAISVLGKGFLTMAGSTKTALVGMLAWVKQGIVSAMAALPGLIASVWSFTAALLANPITWVVIGIIALIAALVLLWQNWDTVSAFVQSVWQKACEGVMAGIDWLKNGINGIINWFTEKLTAFREFGSNMVSNIVDGIKSMAAKPVEAVQGALGKLRELLPFSDAKTGPLSDLTLSGQRVFETMNAGMVRTADLPAETMRDAFADIDTPAPGGIPPAVGGKEPVKQTVIQKLQLNVDMASIEDLKKLKKLLDEIEDETNSNPETGPDEEGAA